MDRNEDLLEIISHYTEVIKNDSNIPFTIAAVNTLLHYLKTSNAETMIELEKKLKEVVKMLISIDRTISIASGCELFVRFITLTSIDQPNFEECKRVLISRGEKFVHRALKARSKIAEIGERFIKNGSRILTHSGSRVVFEIFIEALKKNKSFHVFITESRPDLSGIKMKEKFDQNGIEATLIMDSAVGFVMEKIDCVVIGAEGVVESGGILNKIGSYQLAVMAQYKQVPVYVAVESYKFIRFYPFKQRDLPNDVKYEKDDAKLSDDRQHPTVDYTPPDCITLLITNIGVLTPSGVSDELIKLYL